MGVVLSGCTRTYDKGPGGTVQVSGTITIAGQPVPKGSINFKPTDGVNFLNGSGGGGLITNGSYTAPGVPPGKYFAVIYLPLEEVEQPKDPVDIPDVRSYTLDFDLKPRHHR